jgi:recombination associated protein RdgC
MMFFKQMQCFQMTDAMRFSAEDLANKLLNLQFQPCLPSLFFSLGWVSPIEEEGASLVRHINGYMAFCLQIEEKILPAIVIRQALYEKIKEIELNENRKIYAKEKLRLKDDIILTLLPRAFTKLTKVYAYIDTKNHWLIVGTCNTKKTEQFLSAFRKSITEDVHAFDLKKLSPTLTQWLKLKEYPASLAIEKSCVLQDPKQKNRLIRCQQQDLFANGVQSFLKDGCEVIQLAFTWQDQLSCVLTSNFFLQGIKFNDELLAQAKEAEAETKQQKFDVDFLIMSQALSVLLKQLLEIFMDIKSQDGISTQHSKIAF